MCHRRGQGIKISIHINKKELEKGVSWFEWRVDLKRGRRSDHFQSAPENRKSEKFHEPNGADIFWIIFCEIVFFLSN